jgi:hypothetical protein
MDEALYSMYLKNLYLGIVHSGGKVDEKYKEVVDQYLKNESKLKKMLSGVNRLGSE